jgi:hypothetical protein
MTREREQALAELQATVGFPNAPTCCAPPHAQHGILSIKGETNLQAGMSKRVSIEKRLSVCFDGWV